jgi:hypothetical protein
MGCVSGTGYVGTTYYDFSRCSDIVPPQNCSYWADSICPNPGFGDKCNALVYGGVNGLGNLPGQNPAALGGVNPLVTQFNVAFTPGNVVSAYIGLFVTIDSGYAFPNAQPYQLSVSLQGQPAPFVVQMEGVNRNPKWLANPEPLPNMGFTNFVITVPSAMLNTLQSPQVVVFNLLTPGWMAVNHTWMTVNTCAPDTCTCNSGNLGGFWTGPGCTQCQDGYGGRYCDATLVTVTIPAEVVEDPHIGGLRAGVAIMTLTTVGFIVSTVWFFLKYRKATRGASGERQSFVSSAKL